MKWLITTKAKIDFNQLKAKLSTYGCENMYDEPPIPLGGEEQVIEVECPRNLPEQLKTDTEILKIHPRSDMTLY